MPSSFQELESKVKNWGRWGEDDERGTLNFLSPNTILAGRECIQTGDAFSLAWPLDERKGIQAGTIPGRVNPLRTMVAINQSYTGDPDGFHTSDDVAVLGLQAATHWDALAHVSYSGKIYNGFPADTIGFAGATHCGIHKTGPIVGRGVLLDVARYLGVEQLEPGYAIAGSHLEKCVKTQDVELCSGDIVLIRTGHILHMRKGDRATYTGHNPGLGLSCVEWLYDNQVAAVATDNLTFEVFPCEDPAVFMPVHMLNLVAMGLTQGQNFFLEDLAEACAKDGRYDFFLEASPEPFLRAVGGLTNPIAIR